MNLAPFYPRLRHARRLALLLALAPLAARAQPALLLDFEHELPASVLMEVGPGNSAEIIAPAELLAADAFEAPSGRHVQRLVWRQTSYDGTRLGRGVEGRSGPPRITREGWFGFRFRVSPDWPMEKRCFFAQMICWTTEFPRTNKTIALAYDGDGRLALVGHYGDVEESERYNDKPDQTANLPLGALVPGRWHSVVIQARYSRSGDGLLRGWLDVEPTGDAPPAPTGEILDIRLGNGAWSSDTELRHGSYQKWGLYAHDAKRYTPGEVRTLYYDDVAFAVGDGPGAWRSVWPGLQQPPAVDPAETAAEPAPTPTPAPASASGAEGDAGKGAGA